MDETVSETTVSEAVETTAKPIVEMEIKPSNKDKSPGDEPCAEQPLAARIEALLISSDRPLTEARLADLLSLVGTGVAKVLRDAIDDLNGQFGANGRAFRIEKLAGGWQILTLPQFGPLLARLHTDRQSSKLSHAALETLSIIAYRQPIIRAEIEVIRGVACGEVLRGLLERRLIKIVGRAEEIGRPMLYGTTGEFLKVFGLARIDDLPDVEGLNPPAKKRSVAKSPEKAEQGQPPVEAEESADSPPASDSD